MTKRTKRRTHLTAAEKAHYQAAVEQFKRDLHPLFCSLKPFADGYKALYTITEAIEAAYGVLGIERPDPTTKR